MISKVGEEDGKENENCVCDLKDQAPMQDPRPEHTSTQTSKSRGMTKTLQVPLDILEASLPCPKTVPMFLEAPRQNKTNHRPTCFFLEGVVGKWLPGPY